MKKKHWKDLADRLDDHVAELAAEAGRLRLQNAALTREVAQMRMHWRPVPIPHPWQPRNPACSLCDEPRDSPRHQVEAETSGCEGPDCQGCR